MFLPIRPVLKVCENMGKRLRKIKHETLSSISFVQLLKYPIIYHIITLLQLASIIQFQVPDLPLPNLVSLSLAYNSLPSVPPEMAAGLNSLRNLDLSFNDLTTVPTAINSLFELRRLSLAANPITVLADTSFSGVADSLEELDIRNLELNTFEVRKRYVVYTVRFSSPGPGLESNEVQHDNEARRLPCG